MVKSGKALLDSKFFNFMNHVAEIFDGIFKKSSGELNILGKLGKVIFTLVLVKFLIKLIYFTIDKALKRRKKANFFDLEQRKLDTLAAVSKNLAKYILYFIAAMTILDIFRVNTSTVLATAGVGGLAIGFGAQSLVKDVITGFFILLEDQFSVGDHVKLGSFEGIVEELGVRVTTLRDFSGDLHIIPNSNISIVTNKTRGPMRSMVTVTIAYEEDIDRALKVIEEISRDLKEGSPVIKEGPTVLGVTALGKYGVDITIIAKTDPLEQWGVERELRKLIKEGLERESIEIPYPKIISLENK